MANEQVNLELVLSANLQNFSAQLDSLANRKIDIPIRFSSDANALSADLAKTKKEAQQVVDSNKQITANLNEQRSTLQNQAFELKQIAVNAKANLSQGGKTAAYYQQQLKALDGASAAIKNNRAQYETVNAKILESVKTTGDFRNRIKELGNQAKISVKQQTEGFFDGLLGKLTIGGILVEGFKQVLQGLGTFIQQGIQFEQLTLGLEAFAGGTENARIAYQAFKETALRTPFSLPGVAQAGKTLLAFGVNLDTALDSTERLGIIAGATGSDLNNLSRNLGQISAQGRAYTRDLNQFATAGIPIYQELSNVLGVSVQEVRKFAEDGKIGFGEVQQALVNMTAAGSAFSDLASRQLETVAGAAGNLETAVSELSGRIFKAFGPTIVDGINTLGTVLNALKDNFEAVAITVGTVLASAFVVKLAPAILGAVSGLKFLIGSIQAFGVATTASIAQAQVAAIGLNTLAVSSNTAAAAQLKLQAAQLQAVAASQAQQLAIVTATKNFATFAGVVGALSVAFILLKTTADAYQPTEALKEDAVSAARFSSELDRLVQKFNLTGVEAQTKVTPAMQSLKDAMDRATNSTELQRSGTEKVLNILTLGVVGWYKYNLAQRQAESDSIAYSNATIAQGEATGKLIDITKDYLTSKSKDINATRELLAVTGNRIVALEADSAATEANIAFLKEQAQVDNEAGRIAKINLVVAQSRLGQNEAQIKALQELNAGLKNTVTLEGLYNTALASPTIENRAEALKEYEKVLKNTIDSVTDLIDAQKTLAEVPVKQLELDLKDISREYDYQLENLKNQKAEYDAILDVLDTQAALQARIAFGKGGSKEILQLERNILANKIASTDYGLLGVQQGRLQYLQDQKRLAGLDAELDIFDKKYDAETEILKISSQSAQKNLDKVQATRDVLTALETERYYADQVVGLLDRQALALNAVQAQATIAGSKINTEIAGSISRGITAVDILAEKLASLSNVQVTVDFKTAPRASGGPVLAGSKYTVNELGKEAFLSASGRLSLINAPAYGTWKAPESGTVIPAHLTKQLNIPAGGINLNNPRGIRANRRVVGVTRSSDARTSSLLHSLNTTQQAQAQQLGKLTRVIDTLAGKEWTVDLNINGNNPLLNKLRRY